MDMEVTKNGHTALTMLKVAVGIVLIGAGSAWTAGSVAASGTEEKFHLHETVTHGAISQSMVDVKRSADQAAEDARIARIYMEALLNASHVPLPKVPPRDGGR